MNKPASHFPAILLALFCGSSLAFIIHHSSSDKSSTTNPVATPSRPGASAPPSSDPTHTLTALRRLSLNPSTSPLTAEEAAAISRMSTPELQELIARIGVQYSQHRELASSGMYNAITHAAVAGLYNSDPAAAIDWAQSLGGDGIDIATQLVNEASLNDPELSATWIQRLRPQFGDGWCSERAGEALAKAPLSGAETTLALEQAFSKNPGPDPFDVDDLSAPAPIVHLYSKPAGYSEDFDFKTYVDRSSQDRAVRDAATYWAARDPDSAWAGLRDTISARPQLFGAMTSGIATMQGEPAAAQWVAARLDDAPAEARAALIASLTTVPAPYSDRENPATDERLAALMTALPRDEDRLTLASQSFTPQDDGTAKIATLQLLPTPELQLQALRASAEKYVPIIAAGERYDTVLWTGFHAAMEQLHLPAEAQAGIREILVQPK
jgi:hypothetical protein